MGAMVQSLMQPLMVTDTGFVANVKKMVLRMYDLPDTMEYFCGALPCSLMRADLRCFQDMEYLVAEKTDGVRNLMLICRDHERVYTLLVDRGFRFYYTDVKFSDYLRQGLGTLLDGEIIWEPTGFKYYVHDIVCLAGKPHVATQPYRQRMEQVTNILRWACFPPDPESRAPLQLQLLPKQLYPMKDLGRVWHEIIPRLAHRSDGLILTPDKIPHTGKKNKLMFKYKEPSDHTIDLQLDRRLDHSVGDVEGMDSRQDGLGPPYPAYQLQTWDTRDRHDFCAVSMSPERWAQLGFTPETGGPDGHRGAIVECRYNEDRVMWVPVAWRTDKLVPNDVHTVQRTIETMIESLTVEELLNISRHLPSKFNNNQSFGRH